MPKYSDSIKARLSGRHLKSLELARPFKDKTILNVGCYNGWLESFAVKEGARGVVGVDTCANYVDLAARNVPGAEFLQASVLELPSGENTFDIVCLFEVLEHLPKGKEPLALSEIHRVLKKDGKLVLSVPNDTLVGNILDPAWYLGHRHYKKERLVKLVEEAGFRVEKIEVKGGLWQVLSLPYFYLFKWVFKSEIPFKDFVNKKKEKEYLGDGNMFVTRFLLAMRIP